MKQKIITLVVIILITALMSWVVIASSRQEQVAKQEQIEQLQQQTEPIFYYGNTCPHCEIVKEWFADHQVEEQITIFQKEVYDNAANAAELNQVAASCGLDSGSIGVPFLYADGQCLIGSPDIISYFSQKLGIVEATSAE